MMLNAFAQGLTEKKRKKFGELEKQEIEGNRLALLFLQQIFVLPNFSPC